MAAREGKFDTLTKELITHVLGFKEGEENFVRSEQFVLSNLLYHHCLAVNSHAVRRSLDGLALKFTVHGQHQRTARLKTLVAKFLALPFFKDHYETDLEWSLLSLLLHLSNSPTQVPLGEGAGEQQRPLAPLEESQLQQVDWAAYLKEDEPEYQLGPEEPLSDWSGDDDENGSEGSEETESPDRQPCTEPFALPTPAEAPSPIPGLVLTKPPTSRLRTLEQLHRAKSWLSAKTHLQYWGPKKPHELPASKHPLANVAKICRDSGTSGSGERQCCQQLSEWSVMREVVWSLMCPVSSYVFVSSEEGRFSVREGVTISSLTPCASQSMLEYLCEPLQQLRTLDLFLLCHSTPCLDPPTPSTVMAYTSGLQHWRQAFTQHLRDLEDTIKGQESSGTLLWLEGEVLPWLRAVAILHTLHSKAFALPPHASSRSVAVRLLGCVCEAVESAGEERVRGVLLRLLLHTFRPYLSIMHTWLTDGALTDHAQEFIIHRDESVTVYDERFWHKAFTLSSERDELSQSQGAGSPVQTIMKVLAPLLSILTSVGKSQELLAALDVPPVALQSDLGEQSDCSLEEVVVLSIKNAVCKPLEEDKEGQQDTDINSSTKEEDSSTNDTSHKNRRNKNSTEVASSPAQTDPLLWAAFSETPPLHSPSEENSLAVDRIASLIEGIGDIPAPISVVFLLSSALQSLVRRRQAELSAELTRVLLSEHRLALHCHVVRAVLLMEAGDVMHEFYSHIFSKLETGELVDSISLTLHLQYCVSRLYPDLAQHFSVSLPLGGTEEEVSGKASPAVMEDDTQDLKDERVLLIEELEGSGRSAQERMCDPKHSQSVTCPSFSLTKAGIPALQVHYQAPWPANLLLTEPVMGQYNKLFNFCLSLKRVTNGLERLKFKELSSWNLILHWEAAEDGSANNNVESPQTPLQSRIHRLQLLRQWLLCFARELHDHFANTAFLPFHQTVERLFAQSPPFNTIATEHEKLLHKLTSECLMGRDEKILPLQIVLNKVFWLTQRLAQLWLGDVSRVSVDELTSLETHYAQVHRYLVNFLTTLVSRSFTPHLEGLTRTLVDTVPLLTHR